MYLVFHHRVEVNMELFINFDLMYVVRIISRTWASLTLCTANIEEGLLIKKSLLDTANGKRGI